MDDRYNQEQQERYEQTRQNEHDDSQGYLVIPNNIIYDQNLNWNEKIILSYVWSYRKKTCWMSNATFERILGKCDVVIQTAIKGLKEKGYIKTRMECTSHGTIRHMWPTTDWPTSEETHPPQEYLTPLPKSSCSDNITDSTQHTTYVQLGAKPPVHSDTPKMTRGAARKPSASVASLRKDVQPKAQPTGVRNDLVEFWNSQAAGSKSKDPTTQVYKRAARLLKSIQASGFTNIKLDQGWVTQQKINTRRSVQPFNAEHIQRGLERMSRAMTDGYWPGPDSKMSKWPLADLIYNEATQKSFLLQCLLNEPSQVREKVDDDVMSGVAPEDVKDIEGVIAHITQAILDSRVSRSLNGGEPRQVCKMAQEVAQYFWDLCKRAQPHWTTQRCPLDYGFFSGLETFARRYAESINERYIQFGDLTVGHIKIGSRHWDSWIQAMEEDLGMSFTTGKAKATGW